MNTNDTPPIAAKAIEGGRTTEQVRRDEHIRQSSAIQPETSAAPPAKYRRQAIETVADRVARDLRHRLRYDPAARRFEAFDGRQWIREYPHSDAGAALGVLVRIAHEVTTAAKPEHRGAAAREAVFLCSAACFTTVRARLRQILAVGTVGGLSVAEVDALLVKFGVTRDDALHVARSLTQSAGRTWTHTDYRAALSSLAGTVRWDATDALDDERLVKWARAVIADEMSGEVAR